MKEGLAALTKLVKVVIFYRPDRAKKAKPQRRKPRAPSSAQPKPR